MYRKPFIEVYSPKADDTDLVAALTFGAFGRPQGKPQPKPEPPQALSAIARPKD